MKIGEKIEDTATAVYPLNATFNVLQTFTDEEFEEIFAHYDQASLCREILINEY